MSKKITLNINGDHIDVDVEAHETLFDTIRERLELVSVKKACDTGGCGCCTVLIDGKSRYSCMTYTRSVRASEITTVEGLGSGNEIDPVQEAFIDAGAVQCGYCTCGMIISAKDLLMQNNSPSEEEIRKGIAGNLCRCTGYKKIVEAVKIASG
jgi:carbon-monoxide dehydrogenase small subunit